MAYPRETEQILIHRGYAADVDFQFIIFSATENQLDWHHPTDPKPTEQQVWDWRPAWQRDDIKARAHSQIRVPSAIEQAEDRTRKWVTDQDINRYKILVEQLAQTSDQDLDGFLDDLLGYDQAEPDYARNLVKQETENLALDSELRAAGNGGIFSDAERADVQSRVTVNAEVARGRQTGVRTPDTGAPRELVTMDGEVVERASFWEVSFDWSAQSYYIPKVTMEGIPAGVDPGQVYAMVYNADNTYLGWMPFAQEGDLWATPSDVNYISLASQSSTTWRVAVAYGGTTSEAEITSRVTIVPPNSSWSRVRWGGRNGQPQRVQRPRRRR